MLEPIADTSIFDLRTSWRGRRLNKLCAALCSPVRTTSRAKTEAPTLSARLPVSTLFFTAEATPIRCAFCASAPSAAKKDASTTVETVFNQRLIAIERPLGPLPGFIITPPNMLQ